MSCEPESSVVKPVLKLNKPNGVGPDELIIKGIQDGERKVQQIGLDGLVEVNPYIVVFPPVAKKT